ncbi:hypothetical protein Nmel_005476, partial [Mimus melanotis]
QFYTSLRLLGESRFKFHKRFICEELTTSSVGK